MSIFILYVFEHEKQPLFALEGALRTMKKNRLREYIDRLDNSSKIDNEMITFMHKNKTHETVKQLLKLRRVKSYIFQNAKQPTLKKGDFLGWMADYRVGTE